MATAAQITANRLNAQRSTGPRTAQGKAASCRNAVRHNLSGATFTLLPGEDVAAFEALLAQYRDEFRPATPHENFLVHQMVQAQWRLSRIERMKAEAFDIVLNVPAADNKSDEGAIVQAMNFAYGQTLDRLERYARTAEQAYYRANRELKQYRAIGQNEAKLQTVAPSQTSGITAAANKTNPIPLPSSRNNAVHFPCEPPAGPGHLGNVANADTDLLQ